MFNATLFVPEMLSFFSLGSIHHLLLKLANEILLPHFALLHNKETVPTPFPIKYSLFY